MFMVLPPEANPNHKVRPTLKTGSMLNEDTQKTWFSRVVLELLESRLASADNSMELSAEANPDQTSRPIFTICIKAITFM